MPAQKLHRRNTYPLDKRSILEAVLTILLAFLLLFAAMEEHPYAFYNLLRLVTTMGAVYWAVQVYRAEMRGWTWVFATVALLMNPFLPLHNMHREGWQPIDVGLGVLLLAWSGYWLIFKSRKTIRQFSEAESASTMQSSHDRLPDLGKYLAGKGTPQKTLFFYPSWEIDFIDVVGSGRYCTTRTQPLDGKLFCATLDFGADILEQILLRVPSATAVLVKQSLEDDPGSIRRLKFPEPIEIGIAACLGNLQQGMYEIFIPLVIQLVYGDDPAHMMETLSVEEANDEDKSPELFEDADEQESENVEVKFPSWVEATGFASLEERELSGAPFLSHNAYLNDGWGEQCALRFNKSHNPEGEVRAWAIRNQNGYKSFAAYRTPTGDVVVLYVHMGSGGILRN